MATYLGFGVSLPPVIHVIVCLIGGFVGGAVIGWLVGELKARTGAHEVIVTIMLNYIMYNLLSFLLGTPTALQQPGQSNLISPPIAGNAALPHVGGPPPQVDAGFLVALAAAAGVWWLLTRSTIGFRFRTVGANAGAARSAGMNVERTWADAMLVAGGLAGLAGAAVILGPLHRSPSTATAPTASTASRWRCSAGAPRSAWCWPRCCSARCTRAASTWRRPPRCPPTWSRCCRA